MKAAPELVPAGVILVAGVVGLVVEILVGGRVVVGISHFPIQTVCLICFPSTPFIWQV